jgi:hypothetical protein
MLRAADRFKASFFKALPIGIGVLIGWFLVYPPDFLRALGWGAYAVTGLLAVLLLLSAVALSILANLPATLHLRDAPEVLPSREIQHLLANYELLGFVQVGPPRQAALSPAALVYLFRHEKEPIVGTVFQPQVVAAKPAFDFVSILPDGRGGLTSSATVQAATLPTAPGSLRQIIAGADVETLLKAHRRALRRLRDLGVAAELVAADELVPLLQRAIAKQRQAFLGSPLRTTVTALWRTVRKRSPDACSLDDQPDLEARVRRWWGG